MSYKQPRLVEEFQAISDAGETYEISVYQDFIDGGTLDKPTNWIPGMKKMLLQDGGHVNWIDDNTFKIVSSGETIRRVH